ncbi:MAG TPA: septation protein SepH [Myxococcota bacterium]|nr:septation protein SepH [Myxococcota bacterium]
MRELRVIGIEPDGSAIICADVNTGAKFKIPADDRLRAASHGDVTRLGQIDIEMNSRLRPREMQARVRAGASVAEIAEIAGEYAGYDAVVSFMQRIETEDDVMRRTSERYLFGWGGYSRFWIYDPVTGAPMSVMDGYWAMVFGEGGLTRFLFFFSFLLYPIFYGWRRIDKIRSKSTQVAICTLAWIVVLRTFDLIPNSTIDPYLTFFGGAICGVVRHESRRRVQAPSAGRRSEREREAEAGERQEGPASLAARLMSDRAPSR